MKKTLSFILSLIMVFGILTSVPLTVNAASESDLVFTLSDNGTYYSVTGCSTEASGKIIVPGEYGGLPVEWIEEYAFQNSPDVTSIVLSDGVEQLAWHAFSGCTNLASVTLGKDVRSIGLSMFENCPNIENIYVDENNEQYSSESGVYLIKIKRSCFNILWVKLIKLTRFLVV